MNTRLEQFISAENISKAEFADNIGVARASLSHVLAGRNNPSFDFIKGMMRRYPRLNMEWLLDGKGKMYKDPVPQAAEQSDAADSGKAPAEPEEPVPDLFSPAPTSPRESNIPGPVVCGSADSAPTKGEPVRSEPIQPLVNQRKIVKIVVFYDDGTYQEMS